MKRNWVSPPPPTSPLRPWVRFLPGRSNDGFLHSFGLLPALGGRREENGLQQLHAGGEGGVPSSEREEEGLFWPAVEAKGEAKGKSAKGLFPLLLVLRLLYLLRLRFDFPRKRSPPSLGGRTNPSLERKGGKRGPLSLLALPRSLLRSSTCQTGSQTRWCRTGGKGGRGRASRIAPSNVFSRRVIITTEAGCFREETGRGGQSASFQFLFLLLRGGERGRATTHLPPRYLFLSPLGALVWKKWEEGGGGRVRIPDTQRQAAAAACATQTEA